MPKLDASLDAVKQNESIEVLTTSKVRFRGRLVDVSPSGLKVETARRTREIPATEVTAVWRPPNRHLKRNLLIGATVGVGLAGMAYAGQGDCNDPTSLCATDGPITWSDVALLTGLGAGIGGLTSALRPGHADPLYFADRPAGSAPAWAPLDGRVYAGEWLEVRRRDTGRIEKGHLASFDEKKVTLFAEPEPRTIPTEMIDRVCGERPSWWRLPLAVGMAAFHGSILGAVACGDSDNCIGAVAGSFAIFYGATGAFMLREARRQAVLYDARRAKTGSSATVLPLIGRGGAGVLCQVRF